MDTLKVLGEPDLVRDSSGVIHNTNTNAYLAHMARRKIAVEAQESKHKIEKLERQNAELNEKLDLILKLLKENK